MNMVKEQVRYNFIPSTQYIKYNEWFFLIIHQNREIDKIKSKICEFLKPIVEEYDSLIEGSIPRTGLRYKLFHFESPTWVELAEINKLYKKVIRDKGLYQRQRNSLEEYISKYVDND